MKIGQGYDIHKLVEGRPLILGGELIPYEKGLFGHSDADVLTHALIDALIGAMGIGDIGELFPDTDNQYKNINSLKLLEEVSKILKNKNYILINADCTIICEKPKLLEYKPKMKENFARILNVSIDDISIKAKTKEKMDSTGEGLSIEAYAAVLLDVC